MRIARLRIFGFRGIKEADIVLNQTSVLIGPNNVGKTTIIEAIALVLGRDGMIRNLTEHDFYGSDPKQADRIKIIATIVGFPSPDPEKFPDWFGIRRGVPKWYNSATNTDSAIPQTSPYCLSCEIAFQARFDYQNLEVETCRYFYDDSSIDNVFLDDIVTPVGVALLRDIGFFLIPANRTWDRMMSFGSELFRRVINSASGLPAESILAERNRLRSPENPLEDDINLKPIIDEVNLEITALFGRSSNLKLRVSTTDSVGILDSVIPHFENFDGTLVPSKKQGSGLISLQSLFLLLHFGKQRIAQGKGFCFALEEPEMHLPPAIQRRVLSRLKTLSSQVVISTHSSLIAGFSEPIDLFIINNLEGVLTAKPLLKQPLDTVTPNSIRTLIQVKRVEVVSALMAEIVLVPEGLIDYEWLILLMRVLELNKANSLTSATIGIIPTQNAAICVTTSLIKEVHPNIIALVDGDSAGTAYINTLKRDSAQRIIQWPNNWMIEDVVGWILHPAETSVLEYINNDRRITLTNIAEVVSCLKNDNSKDPIHLKGDRVVYENLARIISDSDECLSRVVKLFDGMLSVGKSNPNEHFVQIEGTKIFTFTV